MSENETIRLEVGFHAEPDYRDTIDTGITRAEWDAMTHEAREQVCAEQAKEIVNERAYAWAKPKEPGEPAGR